MKMKSEWKSFGTLFTIIAVVLAGILAGCGSKDNGLSKTVVASFAPQEWLLRQIAGDSINIVTLLPPGNDAENYQPSPSTLKAVADADVWFTLGTDGFESSLRHSITSNFPTLFIMDCSVGIDKIYGTHDGEDSFDPHMLSSFVNSIIITRNMTEKLCEIYPEKADYFKDRSQKLIKRLSDNDELIKNLGITGSKFAVRHPSLSYFARDYDLVQLPLEIEGKEATPRQIQERIDEIIRQKPDVLVIDKAHGIERDAAVAKDLGIDTVTVELDSQAWLENLLKIAQTLSKENETDIAR